MLHQEILELSVRRRKFTQLAVGLEADLITLGVAEYAQTNGNTPVASRATDRLMMMVALFDPSMIAPNPEAPTTKEQHDFPDA
jgi:hypothetical protein